MQLRISSEESECQLEKNFCTGDMLFSGQDLARDEAKVKDRVCMPGDLATFQAGFTCECVCVCVYVCVCVRARTVGVSL